MPDTKRIIDAFSLTTHLAKKNAKRPLQYDDVLAIIANEKTVKAVEVSDRELLKAIKLFVKQYEQSKDYDFVQNPIAYALYHTWKQVDSVNK